MKTKLTSIGALALILTLAVFGASGAASRAVAGPGTRPNSGAPAAGTQPMSDQSLALEPRAQTNGSQVGAIQSTNAQPMDAQTLRLEEKPAPAVVMRAEDTRAAGAPAVFLFDSTYTPWGVDLPAGVLEQLRSPTRPDALNITVVYNPAASCPPTHPANAAWTLQTWPAAATTSMNRAALIWSTLLNGDRPVIVHACWYSSLGANVLGQATPSNSYQNFANAPQSNTWYPVALANQLANTDLNGGTPEIGASFSAGFTWYYGFDGNIPVDAAGNPTAVDFLSVALHEIGHGLGFAGGANWDNGAAPNECNGTAGNGCVSNPPFAYDRFAQSGGVAVVGGFTNPSAALGNALIGNALTFNGANATGANGNNPPRLFAPNTWQPGSSYVHLDEGIFNNTVNALMTPALGNGEYNHYPGPVGLGVLADIGWLTNGFLSAFVDWSNAGFEDGTSEHPYNTVQEGVAAVRDDGIVFIAGGHYDEAVTITRPMVLLRVGGVVTIGE